MLMAYVNSSAPNNCNRLLCVRMNITTKPAFAECCRQVKNSSQVCTFYYFSWRIRQCSRAEEELCRLVCIASRKINKTSPRICRLPSLHPYMLSKGDRYNNPNVFFLTGAQFAALFKQYLTIWD